MIQTLLLFQMQITLLTCLLDTGLYHNIVSFSLAPNQRLGNKVHNCKMAYYHDCLNRATLQLTFCTLSGGCNPWFVYLYKISPIKSCTQALPVQVEKLKKKISSVQSHNLHLCNSKSNYEFKMYHLLCIFVLYLTLWQSLAWLFLPAELSIKKKIKLVLIMITYFLNFDSVQTINHFTRHLICTTDSVNSQKW